MRIPALLALVGLAAAPCLAGTTTVTFLSGWGATDVNVDGTVIVGNSIADGAYETVRWTADTGAVWLGRATVPVLGVGAGLPGVSADGTRISATILSDDETYAAQGLWSLAGGWQELAPIPSDGGIMDQSNGSAWGISGDGKSVVGLYWRPGQPGGSAHPSLWRQGTGVTDLGSAGGSGRANRSNRDGSVIAGWTEDATTGVWRPTAWIDGQMVVLTATEAFCEASCVNGAGTVIGGSTWDTDAMAVVAAAWRPLNGAWIEQRLGVLDGTIPGWGQANANGVSGDGSVIVGWNSYDFGPWGEATGFVWTAADGMVRADDYLKARGVTLDADIHIDSLNGISEDGSTIIGSATNYATFEPLTIVIRACVADFDGNGKLDVNDFIRFQAAWKAQDARADWDHNGVFNINDFVSFQAAWRKGC